MNFRTKLPFLICTIVVILFLGFLLSDLRSFDGDELGTFNDIKKIHKPIPYAKIVLSWIKFLEPINISDIFFLRLSSLFFTILTILLWFIFSIKSKFESILYFIITVTSCFLLSQTIYFRYYSYYLLSSTVIFFFLTTSIKQLSTNLKLLACLIGLMITPFLFHILNGIQFGVYFLYVLLFEKIKYLKIRLVIIALLFLMIISIVINPSLIWSFFNWLNIIEALNINTQTSDLHGLNIRVLIKPIYAVYQMIFGFDLAPTDSLTIIILAIFFFLLLLIQTYKLFTFDKKMFFEYLIIGIVPFLIIYLFFQTISFPGFTQLETKHGILVYPVLLSVIIKSHNYLSKPTFIISFSSIIIFQLIGTYNSFTKSNTDWNYVLKKIDNYYALSEKPNILMDGRSYQPFKFYNQKKISEDEITFTWELENSLNIIQENGSSDIILLVNDYKSYTNLSLYQNWNAGKDSYNRVSGLNKIIQSLNKYYRLSSSYVNYPTFLYFLERKANPDDNLSVGVWQHNLKDLRLPIIDNSIKSSLIIKPLDSIKINYLDRLILNIEECRDDLENLEKVGIFKINNKEYDLINGLNIWDLFSENNNIKVKEDHVFHSWYHRPLISGSIKYNGSYFGHKAKIYQIKLEEENNSENILIKNTSKTCSIRIWL